MHDCPEISDLIVDYDAATLARRPVKKSTVLESLAQHQNAWGLRIARRFPAEGIPRRPADAQLEMEYRTAPAGAR